LNTLGYDLFLDHPLSGPDKILPTRFRQLHLHETTKAKNICHENSIEVKSLL
jgi:hypothetical protein